MWPCPLVECDASFSETCGRTVVSRCGCSGVIEMRVQLIFRNEPAGLTEDGAEGADIQTGVSRNSLDLSPIRSYAFQLHMAATLGDDEKP